MLTEDLLIEYERLTESCDSMRVAILALTDEVRRLKQRHSAKDPRLAWLDEHPEEPEKYIGMNIAVHPTLGVVASGHDGDDIWTKLRSLAPSVFNDTILLSVAR